MAKNEMKTTRVVIVIMIVLGLSQANCNPPFVQIGPNCMFDKFNCHSKCALECAPLLLTPGSIAYAICVTECEEKCHKKSINVVHDCIIDCGLAKSIDINIDARGLAANMVDSCVQEC
ncbi:hypothetical protein E2542_SST22516 [Spatholobus suberectus]|nr:hypothetical protein E2542_SST22516 [Spatholobus suberectus]